MSTENYRVKNKHKIKKLNHEYYVKNKDKYLKWGFINRLKKYGITLEKYKNMFDEQNGECSICGIKFDNKIRSKTPCIDHCHNSGIVRSLLCTCCNTGIANLREDTNIIGKAIVYLNRFTSINRSMI